MKIVDIKKKIEKILDDNKATNLISINLKNKSYIADYMIIASGTSSRHLQALSEILVSELKKIGLEKCHIEGRESSDWKLVDTKDIIIHIFHPEKRKFYDLEKMWSEEIPKEKEGNFRFEVEDTATEEEYEMDQMAEYYENMGEKYDPTLTLRNFKLPNLSHLEDRKL